VFRDEGSSEGEHTGEEKEIVALLRRAVERDALPDDAVGHPAMGRLIRQCLARLPDAERDALLLHAAHDLSLQEIARVMGCSVAAVECRLRRAEEMLLVDGRGTVGS
jgi:RNA polymerase sigma factor (sigma-70 family)